MTQKQKLAIFDVDGTLTLERSVWEYLHRSLGIWESEGLPNFNAYLKGEIDYNEFARLDAWGYRDLKWDYVNEMVRAIPRRDGISTLFSFLKAHGYTIALVSTGLDILLNQFPDSDIRIANKLIFEEGICTGRAEVVIPIDAKRRVVTELCREQNVDISESLVFGDSRGDVEIMTSARLAIAVNPSHPDVTDAADLVIHENDLTAAIPLIQDIYGLKE